MSNIDPTYDILYAHNNLDRIITRLEGMASHGARVTIRLEMPVSPVSVTGTMARKCEDGRFLVQCDDQVSYAAFALGQVTSMGLSMIWINA